MMLHPCLSAFGHATAEQRLLFRNINRAQRAPQAVPDDVRMAAWDEMAEMLAGKEGSKEVVGVLLKQLDERAVDMNLLRAADADIRAMAKEELGLTDQELKMVEPRSMQETYAFLSMVERKVSNAAPAAVVQPTAVPVAPQVPQAPAPAPVPSAPILVPRPDPVNPPSVPPAPTPAPDPIAVPPSPAPAPDPIPPSPASAPDPVPPLSPPAPAPTPIPVPSAAPAAPASKPASRPTPAPATSSDAITLTVDQTEVTPEKGKKVTLYDGLDLESDAAGKMSVKIDATKWNGGKTNLIEVGAGCRLIKNKDGSYVMYTKESDGKFIATPITLDKNWEWKDAFGNDTRSAQEKTKEWRIIIGEASEKRMLTNVCYSNKDEVRRLMTEDDGPRHKTLAHASPELRKDKAFALEAIKASPENLQYLDQSLIDDKDIVTAAMNKSAAGSLEILQNRKSKWSTDATFLSDFAYDQRLMSVMDKKTRDLITNDVNLAKKVVEKNVGNMRWIDNEAVILTCIETNTKVNDPFYVLPPHKTSPKILFALLKNHKTLADEVPFLRTRQVNLHSANITPEQLAAIDEKTLQTILKSDPNSFEQYSDAQRSNPVLLLTAIQSREYMLRFVPETALTKDLLVKIMNVNGLALRWLPRTVQEKMSKEDLKIVYETALAQNEAALQFIAGEDVRKELQPVQKLNGELAMLGKTLGLELLEMRGENTELVATRQMKTILENAVKKLDTTEKAKLADKRVFIAGSKKSVSGRGLYLDIPCGTTEDVVIAKLKDLASRTGPSTSTTEIPVKPVQEPVGPKPVSPVAAPESKKQELTTEQKEAQRKTVDTALKNLSEEGDAKSIFLWTNTEYDNYIEIQAAIPKIRKAITALTAEQKMTLKSNRIVIGTESKFSSIGIVETSGRDKVIALKASQTSEEIKQTLAKALDNLAAHPKVNSALKNIAREVGVKDVFLWNNTDYGDYPQVENAIPKIKSAIATLTAEQKKKLSNNRIVIQQEDTYSKVGVVGTDSGAKVIGIKASQTQEEIRQTIIKALDDIDIDEKVKASLKQLAKEVGIKDIFLWSNEEYDNYAAISAAIPIIKSVIASFTAEQKKALGSMNIVVEPEGKYSTVGVKSSKSGVKNIAIKASQTSEEIKDTISKAIEQITMHEKLKADLAKLAKETGVKDVFLWSNHVYENYGEILSALPKIRQAITGLTAEQKKKLSSNRIVIQKEGKYSDVGILATDSGAKVIGIKASQTQTEMTKAIADALEGMK